ncbi:hypothetical protein RF11_07209 [Thelohanellus kitauei]|uniref:Uncharacterized protein n=1 Tax=Thelohanellus kitauei TaxID=669202 RepID=A0A0C2MS12_THEKT|nr:hypothetical protein RF11_07209 [Thelohanellus kitauei]
MLCFERGYIIEKEFNDVTKAQEFYDWADDLSRKYNYQHVCRITSVYMKIFCDRVSDCRDSKISAEIKEQNLYFIIKHEMGILRRTSIIFTFNIKLFAGNVSVFGQSIQNI